MEPLCDREGFCQCHVPALPAGPAILRQEPARVAECIARREREGWLGWLLKAMAWITLAIAPVLILLAFQFAFLPYHSHLATWMHRFLIAAHDTFALLATQPNMGWRPRLKNPELESLRVFRVRGFEKILILYRPLPDGFEILRMIHGSRHLQTLLLRNGL